MLVPSYIRRTHSIAFSSSDYALVSPHIVDPSGSTTLCHAIINTTSLRESVLPNVKNSLPGHHVLGSAGITGFATGMVVPGTGFRPLG